MHSDELVFHHFSAELEPRVLQMLHAGFGETWGDCAYWRWKHSSRPGFSPLDVSLISHADKPVACFHLTVRSLRMGPGLALLCSIEGDFAIEPRARGRGIPKCGYRAISGPLAQRSVVLRAGFSSPELFENVYKRSFGHRLMPTVTAQYRKILSDRLLREKLCDVGNQLRLRPRMQRLLAPGALTVRLEISGFQPCDLVLTRDSASCTDNLVTRPDLRVHAPYLLLTASRMPRLPALFALVRTVLSGQARVRGLLRVLARFVAVPARS